MYYPNGPNMTLFKLSNIFHYVLCMILTISTIIMWNVSFEPRSNFKLSSICPSLTGCKANTSDLVCYHENISCTGSKRCCFDCFNIYASNSKNQQHGMKETSVKFDDIFISPLIVSIGGASTVLVLHILLLMIMHKYSKSKSYIHQQNKICKVIFCCILTVILVTSTGLFLYNVGFIAANIHFVQKCQPNFILLISWCWILFLWLKEFVVDLTPCILIKDSCQNQNKNTPGSIKILNTNNQILKCFLKPLNCISKIVFLWWFAVPIYLVVVTHKIWHIHA